MSYGLWEFEIFRMPSQFDGTRIAMGSREGSEPAVASDEWRLPQQTPTTNKRGRPLRVGGGPSCSESNSSEAPVRQQLRKALFRGTDPFDAALLDRVDHRYPHSNLRASFVKSVFDVLPSPPRFWLEIGSFVGNSVITTVAVAAHLCVPNLTVVSVDPFVGDKAMWSFQRLIHGGSHPPFGYNFLGLDTAGRPTIRDRYMANVKWSGAYPWVVLHASAHHSAASPQVRRVSLGCPDHNPGHEWAAAATRAAQAWPRNAAGSDLP